MKIAICPGSFDPVTIGHLDVIERACALYDKIIVAVIERPRKIPLFSLDERMRFIVEATASDPKVSVESFNCLSVEFALNHGAHVIIRGLRAVSDFEHEFQMAQFNRKLDSTIETLFIMASPEYMFLSSSAVKEIAEFGGTVTNLVPPAVEKRLKEVFLEKGRGGL